MRRGARSVGDAATVEACGLDAACADCSRSQSARDGACFSTATTRGAARPRGCASQHDTLQNTSPVRGRLQVETLHTQCCAPNAIGVLHEEHAATTNHQTSSTSERRSGAGRQVIFCQVIAASGYSALRHAASRGKFGMPRGPWEQSLPRRPRVDHPGAFHHVIVRGVDRREIFLDDADRVAYCERLSLVFLEDGASCLRGR